MVNWQESIPRELVDSYEELGLGTTDPPLTPTLSPAKRGRGIEESAVPTENPEAP
jgi:hypothetical protein